MSGPLSSLFVGDHRRLEMLLDRSFRVDGQIDESVYSNFRSGLLKHIGMEEKIILPAIKQAQNGLPYPLAETLRLEHGAFAALLVPPPSKKIAQVIRTIMNHHNELEEGEEGLYAVCERLMGNQVQDLIAHTRNYPEVPVMPHVYNSNILEATRRAVARAGYDFDQFTE
jgi:hypothetical protein